MCELAGVSRASFYRDWEQKAPATVVPQDEQNGIGVPPLPLTLRHRVAGVQRARILKLVRLTDCNLSFTIRYDLRLLTTHGFVRHHN